MPCTSSFCRLRGSCALLCGAAAPVTEVRLPKASAASAGNFGLWFPGGKDKREDSQAARRAPPKTAAAEQAVEACNRLLHVDVAAFQQVQLRHGERHRCQRIKMSVGVGYQPADWQRDVSYQLAPPATALSSKMGFSVSKSAAVRHPVAAQPVQQTLAWLTQADAHEHCCLLSALSFEKESGKCQQK